jgi:hypothetical protein
MHALRPQQQPPPRSENYLAQYESAHNPRDKQGIHLRQDLTELYISMVAANPDYPNQYRRKYETNAQINKYLLFSGIFLFVHLLGFHLKKLVFRHNNG